MKDKFIKNGVFSLEYDKETLRDMVLELQEENQKLKAEYGTKTQIERDLLKEENEKLKAELQLYKGALKRENEAIHRVNDLEEVIGKAIDLIEKSVITDVGVDSNNNIIHYHQLTEDETGELLDILKEVK